MTLPKIKFSYADPVVIVQPEAIKLGMIPEAIDVLQTRVSREITEGKWVQAHGVPVRQEAPGEPFLTMAEWLETMQETHRDYWPVSDAPAKTEEDAAAQRTADADATFDPDQPINLRLRGDFFKKYGEAAYNEEMQSRGATATKQATTKAERGEDQSGNPWHPSFAGDRQAAIVNFIKTFGTVKATAMARAASSDISGRPLRRA
jgi:hypothetical protein